MTKTELVTEVKEILKENGLEVSNAKAKAITDDIFGTIAETLRNGEEVVLPEIGKLVVVETAPRAGKVTTPNGEVKEYSTPAGKTVKFKISSPFKKSL